MRNFLESFEGSDVIKSLNAGWKSTMEAEKLIFDNGREGQVIEEFSEAFPDIWITIFAAAFIIEAVYLRDLPWFMVSSEDGDSIFVSDLEGDQEGDGFDAVVSWIL